MSPGKIAAQAAHAETLAMHDYFVTLNRVHELDPEDLQWARAQEQLYSVWFGYGHYTKYVMKSNDSTQMFTQERYIKDRGFKTYMVVDEGHTEETHMVPTAMAVELIDKDDERSAEAFSNFRLYKEPRPPRDTSQPQGGEKKSKLPWRNKK